MTRPLYQPTPDETIAACETLLRNPLPREARTVVREILEKMEAEHGATRA